MPFLTPHVLLPQIFGLDPANMPHEVERRPLEPAQGDSDVSCRFNALLGCVILDPLFTLVHHSVDT